ncbi:hypothetical protein STAS_24976 [Striga asiatica]|uniref:Uncharacterized protein n=1 Tax=Striga asiatica TaxID=4170 RepID=A0A5A7QR66_STRAF|nr:hypothetical protein STAS_24976 [Striga asiatica]
MTTNLVNMGTKFPFKTFQNTPQHPNRQNDPIFPAMGTHNSGDNSPPSWKPSGSSPHKSPSHPLLGRHRRSSSPDSRAEAIARGQWELMEMVRNMPESCYELSLKDLVESHRELTGNGSIGDSRGADLHRRAAAAAKSRVGGFENRGMYLKMAFPFSVEGNKKKEKTVAVVKNYGGGGDFSGGRVSPSFDVVKGGSCEVDWWRKGFTASSDSDSSRTSGGGRSTTTVSSGGGNVSSGGGGAGPAGGSRVGKKVKLKQH